MPKVKIPRKSTAVDMTAMCDVAFLLLSFFILATKQKPPEVLTVQPPNSVSAEAAPEKSVLITMTKDGRTFLMLGDETKKQAVLENINLTKALNLTPAEIQIWSKQQYIGQPLSQIKGMLDGGTLPGAETLPGIPTDSAHNEMTDWMRSVTNTYAGMDMKDLANMILIKGDVDTKYPAFKNIKEAFKKNELFRFRIITNGEAPPSGSELALHSGTGAKTK